MSKSKYKVVKVNFTEEVFLSSFLGETQEEATEVYNKHSNTLHRISMSYHLNTGLSKADLFSEALVGLARAVRDFDINRSDNFDMFASYKIKEALHHFMRKNMSPVRIPSYIKKAHTLINKLKNDIGEEAFRKIADNGDIRSEHLNALDKLISASVRCKLSLQGLIKRAEFLPLSAPLEDKHLVDENSISCGVFVNELKAQMNDNELIVSEGIMDGRTYTQIAEENGRSVMWVSKIVKNMKDKFSGL